MALIPAEKDQRLSERRIRIRVPKQYQQDPVISRLVSHYHLTVNIKAAILGANANGDGWFDLELRGSASDISEALVYLQELDLEVWNEGETDGW